MSNSTKKIILSTIFILLLIVDMYLYIVNPLNKTSIDLTSGNDISSKIWSIGAWILIAGGIVAYIINKKTETEKLIKEYFYIVMTAALGVIYFFLK